jgi:membrane protein DedA with SNARE-associated domain
LLFTLSAIPNPFFDFAGAIAGAIYYPLWKFLLFCWAGKTIKGLMVAFAGAWGLRFILHWLNIIGF